MRTISEQELKDILEKHGKWIRNEEGGEKADLSFANLSFANLSSANLRSANLSFANLSFADLRSANLRSANLRSADLSSANLRSANLSFANLSFADLSFADLVVFQYQRHWAYFTFDGFLRIGCHHMPISEWLLGYKELGAAGSYSQEQILIYGNFIKSCAELFELKNKGGPKNDER